jgi:hypothetical protein
MLRFSCPKCKAFQTVDDQQAGQRYACVNCGQVLRVPSALTPVTPGSAPTSLLTAGPPPSAGRPPLPLAAAPSGTARAEVRSVNGRRVVFWPCTFCKVGLNTGYENVGLTIQCPACHKSVAVPHPLTNHVGPGLLAGGRAAGRPVSSRKRAILRVAVVALGLAILVGCVVAVLRWQPWARSKKLSEDQVWYLPDGCQVVAALDVQGLRASSAYHKVKGEFEDVRAFEQGFKELLGLELADMTRVVVGGQFENLAPDFTVVVTTSRPFRAGDLLKKTQNRITFVDADIGPHKMYTAVLPETKPQGAEYLPNAFAVVGANTLVVGPAASVRRVLKRDRKPEFAASLQPALDQTDFSQTFALAVGKVPENILFLLRWVRPNLGKLVDFLDKFEGGSMEIQVSSRCDAKVRAIFPDAEMAGTVEKFVSNVELVKNFAKMPHEMFAILDTLKARVDGNVVTWTLHADVDKLIQLVERTEPFEVPGLRVPVP